MKRKLFASAACMLLLISLFATTAYARMNVVRKCSLDLSFVGASAICSLYVDAVDSSANISATMRLQKKDLFGNYGTIASWNASGVGTLDYSTSYTPVTSGTYRLEADIYASSSMGNDNFGISTVKTK